MNIPNLFQEYPDVPELLWAAKRRSSENVAPHSHPCNEIIYVHEGEAIIHIENETVRAVAGTAMFIPPKTMHDQVHEKYACNDFVKFLCGESLFGKSVRVISGERARLAGVLTNELSAFFSRTEKVGSIGASGLIIAIAAVLTKQNGATEKKTYSHPAMCKAADYIHANLSRNLTLMEISRESCVSTGHLIRLFKQETGLSPIAFLQKQRLEQTKEMLLRSHYSIQEIALKCGYNDASYFSRVFRAGTGISPHEYRNSAAT